MRIGMTFSLLLALSTFPLRAQINKPPPVKIPVRIHPIRYVSPTPVLGLPPDAYKLGGLCSSNGLTYFEGSSEASSPQDLYTLATSAEVKHVRRKLPIGYTDLTLKSFFPSDHTIVSLLEASNRAQPGERPHASDYFLSTSDPTGDLSDLIALQLHFKPLKVAVFGSGDYLVLGMDTANQVPLLARLKDDGTVRRFVDLGAMQRAGADVSANDKLTANAAFVPFGDDILLTFPGTTEPLHILRDRGEDGVLQLAFFGRFTLHDVLGSERRPTLVARYQASSADDKQPPVQKLYEFSLANGELLWELALDKVPVEAATCAAKQSLTSVWMKAQGTPANDTGGKPAQDEAKQLVVGTARR